MVPIPLSNPPSLFFFDTTCPAAFFQLLMIGMEQILARLGDEPRTMKESPPAQLRDDWRRRLEDFETLEQILGRDQYCERPFQREVDPVENLWKQILGLSNPGVDPWNN